MRLVDVPDDVFLHILSHLTIQDILALKQVSHGHDCGHAVLTGIHADMPWLTRSRKLGLPLAQAR